jgi:predicted transcriptional regulator
VKQLATDFTRIAEGLRRGTIAAKEAAWDRPTKRLRKPRKVEERQAAPVVQAVVEAVRSQQEAVAEAVAPRRTDLDYWAGQMSEGWVSFDDLLTLEIRKRLDRIPDGIDPDYDAIHEKAMDDIMKAVDRYEAKEKGREAEAKHDRGRKATPEAKRNHNQEWER